VPTYVALLRGINVGGKNLIRMPALKAAFEDEGFEDVATYIQSGNVVFAAPAARATDLTHRIESMLAEAFDYVPTVVVRSHKQLRATVDGAPKGFGTPALEVPLRRDLPEGAALGEDGLQGRADEPGRRRGACRHRRPLLLEAHREGHGEPSEQDRLVADLPERDDPELEHDDQAALADG
jgi:hypothetical protein